MRRAVFAALVTVVPGARSRASIALGRLSPPGGRGWHPRHVPDREFPIRFNLERQYVSDPMAAKIAASRLPVVPPDIELLRHRLRYCPGVEVVHPDGRTECRDGGCNGGQLHAWSYPCDCCER